MEDFVLLPLNKKDIGELAERISTHRKLDKKDVIKMLRYNAWTFRQYSELTGFREGSISNKGRPKFVGGEWVSDIDIVFPFPSMHSSGPRFVVNNEKSRKYIFDGV